MCAAKPPPSERHLLGIYLNDHFAASVLAVELTDRRLEHPPSPALEQFLRRFRREMEEERDALRYLLKGLGEAEMTGKKGLAWVADKMLRFKFTEGSSGYGALTLLEELETLTVGIRAKMALWISLQEAEAAQPFLAAIDLAKLQQWAERQHAEIEEHRREAARRAFSPVT